VISSSNSPTNGDYRVFRGGYRVIIENLVVIIGCLEVVIEKVAQLCERFL